MRALAVDEAATDVVRRIFASYLAEMGIIDRAGHRLVQETEEAARS
jgi:hypothetical protein